MSNNSNPRRGLAAAWAAVRGKGYYIVLFACVAAVAVSGVVFVRTAISAHRGQLEPVGAELAGASEQLDVPLTAEEPDRGASARTDAEAAPSVTTMTDDEVSQIAGATVVRPVAGQTLKAYSMDALVYSRTMADWRVHNGVDLAAQDGAQVLAARAGTVSAIYEDAFYGATIELTHEDGYRTVYSNLTPTALVTIGQSVRAGTVLGAVGATAAAECADAPHLHFCVLRGTEYVDPETFLP